MKLIIPGKLPTLNEIIAEAKRHYGQYSDMKALYTQLVAGHVREQKLRPIQQADFIITWYCWNKRKNKDNIMAGQKFIFDGLQLAGVITNDGWRQLRNVEHRFEVDKKNPRIEVMVIEIEEVTA